MTYGTNGPKTPASSIDIAMEQLSQIELAVFFIINLIVLIFLLIFALKWCKN